VRICQAVAGMPLAIELAAAWVRILSCQEILQGLEQPLDFLTTFLQGIPERHRSLEAVFAYSWGFLDGAEREALHKLAVFGDNFSQETARTAAGVPLRVLATLADKSLLQRTALGQYYMHPLLRQYVTKSLVGTGRRPELV